MSGSLEQPNCSLPQDLPMAPCRSTVACRLMWNAIPRAKVEYQNREFIILHSGESMHHSQRQ
jgi:hypothetical protein